MTEFNLDFYEAYDALNKLPPKEISDEIKAKGEIIMQSLPENRELLVSKCTWQLLTTEEDRDSGIYIIRNRETGQLYIGKAKVFNDRRAAHLRGDRRDSKILHTAIRADRARGLTDEEIGKKYLWARIYKDESKIEDLRCYLEMRCIEQYNTLRGIHGSNDYNATKGGHGGGAPQYSSEVINDIAHMLHNGYSAKAVAKILTAEYGDELLDANGQPILKEGDGVIKNILAHPEEFKDRIEDFEKITKIGADGKLCFRDKIDIRKGVSAYSDADYEHLIKSFDSVADAGRWIAEIQLEKYKNGKCDFDLDHMDDWRADHNYEFSKEHLADIAKKSIRKYATGDYAGRPYLGYYWR